MLGASFLTEPHIALQDPYNKITFEIVGDDAAPTYFSIDADKGEIKIQRDIKTDTETNYQVRTVQHWFPVFTSSLLGNLLSVEHHNRNQFQRFLLQIRVVAKDGGTPPMSAVTLVNVNVNRNLNAPRFETANYEQTVLETQPLGVAFVRVQAKDNDQRVSTLAQIWRSAQFLVVCTKLMCVEQPFPRGSFYDDTALQSQTNKRF